MIVVTDGDGNPITLPVSPPCKICISLSSDCIPGIVDLRWDDPFQEPTKIEINEKDEKVCFEIPSGCVGLVATNEGSEETLIV